MSDPYDDQYKYPPPEKMIDKITERRAAASICEAIVWGTVKICQAIREGKR